MSDNDPTRNVSPRQSVERALLVAMAALALGVMVVATMVLLLQR